MLGALRSHLGPSADQALTRVSARESSMLRRFRPNLAHGTPEHCTWGSVLGLTRRAPETFKHPTGNLQVRAGFGPQSGPNQTQNTRQGTHKAAHDDSERFWAEIGVFRRRTETFQTCGSSAECCTLMRLNPTSTRVPRYTRAPDPDLPASKVFVAFKPLESTLARRCPRFSPGTG